MIHFISDLHLHPSRPDTALAFLDFLAGPARSADALWILGDLFEVWSGDEDLEDPFNANIAEALAGLAAHDVTIRLIPGNRDFLLGARFAQRARLSIVREPAEIELGGIRTVLVHGDAECTDDLSYQRFRRIVRNRLFRSLFLALPYRLRRRVSTGARARSEYAKQGKTRAIMDVNPDAIIALLRRSGAIWVIHGHTHRPAEHQLDMYGRACRRYVLPDWHGQACGLQWNGSTLTRF